MKKYKRFLILTFCAIVLSNCEISPKKANAYYEMARFGTGGATPNSIYYDYITLSGMKYVVASSYHGGTVVINLTKDELECEYYRKQLVNKK